MTSSFTKILASATVMLGLTATGAQAVNCLQSDTAGTWQSYTLASNSAGTAWFRCILSINAGGVIAPTTCTVSSGLTVPMTEGSLTLINGARCAFIGKFKLAGVQNGINFATMSQDKQSVEGVGKFPGGGVFGFNLNKY